MQNPTRKLILFLVTSLTALVLAGPASAHIRIGEGAGGASVRLGEGASGSSIQAGDGTSTPAQPVAVSDDRDGKTADVAAVTVLLLGAASVLVVRRRRRSPAL